MYFKRANLTPQGTWLNFIYFFSLRRFYYYERKFDERYFGSQILAYASPNFSGITVGDATVCDISYYDAARSDDTVCADFYALDDA